MNNVHPIFEQILKPFCHDSYTSKITPFENDGTFPDDVLDCDPATERAMIERQDFVDNAIFDMLEELNPSRHELEWDIKPISEIREVIIRYFAEELKICTEDEFYP